MGIKEIKKFLQRRCPDCISEIPITSMTDRTVVFDTNGWVYTVACAAINNAMDTIDLTSGEVDQEFILSHLAETIVGKVFMWVNNGTKPVFVFDGPAPLLKKAVQEKRKEVIENPEARMEELLVLIKETEFFDLDDTHIPEFIDLYRKNLRAYRFIPFVKDFLFRLGFPIFQCNTEGEKLCSMLCVELFADIVFSKDTDNLIYGPPLLVTGQQTYKRKDENGKYIEWFSAIRTDLMYEGLEMTRAQFTDMCIMFGCDYNEGKGIPYVKRDTIYEMTKLYGNIDTILRALDKNQHTLCWQECQEIFKSEHSRDLIWWDKQPLREGMEVGCDIETLMEVGECDIEVLRKYSREGCDLTKCYDSLVRGMKKLKRDPVPMEYVKYMRMF